MSSKYKQLFIDLDDTIWDTQANSLNGLSIFYEQYQLDSVAPFEQFLAIYKRHNHQLWDAYHFGHIKKEELIIRRFRDPLAELGHPITEELSLKYSHTFLRLVAYQTQLLPHAIETLDYLKEKYTLHILSNGFKEVQYIKIENSGLMHYFNRILLSDEIGYNKPHPKIFHHALSATNCKKQDSVMIGDNYTTDITGAKEYGIDQIYFTPTKKSNLPFEPTYTIYSLLELKTIL